MKKIAILFTFCFLLFALSGCGKAPMMDELNKQGFYPYTNEALGFSLSLPQEFQYYQTQRNDSGDFKELDIFVPTADTRIGNVVSGYAEPVIVRAYNKNFYNRLDKADQNEFTKVGEKGDKVYVLKFWDVIPSDWTSKWTKDMKKQIVNNFKLK
jgi:hypothetical protein